MNEHVFLVSQEVKRQLKEAAAYPTVVQVGVIRVGSRTAVPDVLQVITRTSNGAGTAYRNKHMNRYEGYS